MNILIIGAKGMLGKAMMQTWADHDVIGLDLPDIDITKPESIQAVIGEHSPDIMLNAAGYTEVDMCEMNEPTAMLVNGTAVGYLAKASAMYNIPLVHVSSGYVFDGAKESGYMETDAPNPLSVYGRSKLKGEQEAMSFGKKIYIVRSSWLYGPGGKNFVSVMLEHGQAHSKIRAVTDQYSKPTYAPDLSQFIKDLVIDEAPYGIYHGVNEPDTSRYDFVCQVFRMANMDIDVQPCVTEDVKKPARRPAWSSLINTKRPKMRWWSEALGEYLKIWRTANQ